MRAYKIEPMKQFSIVGIGASAGGLAAFEAFFTRMPAVTEPNLASVRIMRRNFTLNLPRNPEL